MMIVRMVVIGCHGVDRMMVVIGCHGVDRMPWC